MHPETLAHTRDRYRHRTRRLHGQSKGVADGGEETISTADRRLARELLLVERRARLRLGAERSLRESVTRRGPPEVDAPGIIASAASLPGGRWMAGRPRRAARPARRL